MALITVIGGRYTGSYTPHAGGLGGAADALGVMEDPGFSLRFTPAWDRVDATDAYGQGLVEKLWLGFSHVGLVFRSKEWETGILKMVNPASPYADTGATTFAPGVVGRRATDAVGGALVLIATAGTPAAAKPATCTFPIITLDSQAIEWIYGPRHRVVPMYAEVVLSEISGSPAYFSAT